MDVPSLIGSKLGGYDIVRLLGRGGMGAVYEGHNPRINRRAAIKVLLPEFVGRADVVARFLNEARAVNSINHPGVVPVSEAENAADGSLYLVMEYVEGETLSARLARSGGQLSEPDVISICWQLADVLHAAHGKGIVHRVRSDRQNPSRSRELMQAEKWPGKPLASGGDVVASRDLWAAMAQQGGDVFSASAVLNSAGCVHAAQ